MATAVEVALAATYGAVGHEILDRVWDPGFLVSRHSCRAGAIGGAILGVAAGGLRASCRRGAAHDDLLGPALSALTGAGSLVLGSLVLAGFGQCHLDLGRSAAVGGLGSAVVGGGLLALLVARRAHRHFASRSTMDAVEGSAP